MMAVEGSSPGSKAMRGNHEPKMPRTWPSAPRFMERCGDWALTLALALLALGGCATKPPQGVRVLDAGLPPGILEQRHQPGPVGLISTSTLPLLRVQWPLRRKEAMRQVSDEADNILYYASIFFPAAFATTPYLTARAATASVSGLSDAEFRRAYETYEASLPQMLVHEGLRRAVADRARARGWTNYLPIPKPYPPGDRAQFQGMAYFMAATLAWLPKGTNAADYLRAQGIGEVLELRIRNAALAGKFGTDRPLALSFDLEARWWRLADDADVSRIALQYTGRERRFAEWMADGGQPFLEELEGAYRACAEAILDWCSGLEGGARVGVEVGVGVGEHAVPTHTSQ